MTPREPFARALRQEELDRLPFWVKIFGNSYIDFRLRRFRDMPGLQAIKAGLSSRLDAWMKQQGDPGVESERGSLQVPSQNDEAGIETNRAE